MRLVIDMNLSPRWIDLLAARGHEAAHWTTIGSPSARDADIMDHAQATGAVVLTHDLDFGAILAATGGRGPSVVQLRLDAVTPEQAGEAVCAALSQFGAELQAGALITVDPRRSRVSLLPLLR